MDLSDFIWRALPAELPVVVLLVLRVLLLFSVALPAVWSRHAGRRGDALAVLRVLMRIRDVDAALTSGAPEREGETLDAVSGSDGARVMEPNS